MVGTGGTYEHEGMLLYGDGREVDPVSPLKAESDDEPPHIGDPTEDMDTGEEDDEEDEDEEYQEEEEK